MDALRRHKTGQAKERLLLGAGYQDQGLVLAGRDGTPMNPAATSQAFTRFIRKAGIRRGSFHACRHTHATLLMGANVHPKVVSERLGHATVGITLDTYSHVLPSMQEEAAKKVNELLAPGMSGSRRP